MMYIPEPKRGMILIRGVPGSGKSTLAANLAYLYGTSTDQKWFEADQFFMVDGVYKWDAANIGAAHLDCMQRVRKHIDLGYTAIVSNTFVKLKELKPYFDIAAEYNIKPIVYLAQNNFNNVHDVPAEVIERMKANFQYDITPLLK